MVKVYGFTGLNASGKSTAAKFLAEKGFNYTSLSDALMPRRGRSDNHHAGRNPPAESKNSVQSDQNRNFS